MMSFYLSGGVEVFGFISPTDITDEYPVIDPLYGIDGFRNVNTLIDLNNIPNLRRRAGMVVGVSGGTDYYKLNPGPWNGTITDWSLFQTGGGSFTGGTVTGDTTFTQGVTASTFSASTYLGLPLDIYVTGGTYSGGTILFTNNSGGTFNVSGLYTGGTFSGYTYVDENTISKYFNVNVNNGVHTSSIQTGWNAITLSNLNTSNVSYGEVYVGDDAVILFVDDGISTNQIIITSEQIYGIPFVTGGTYNSLGKTLTLDTATNTQIPISGFTDTEITGYTYQDNTFTISDNSGGNFSTTIDTVTGLTVSGQLISDTINISSSPTINNDENYVLVRNSTTGDIENRSINSLINTNNTITVGLTGSTGVDFNSIKSAVESITGSSSVNTYTVSVAGGVYYEDPFTIPTWVAVVGESSISTIIQANDPSQTLIHLSDQSAIFDCQIQGCTDTNVSAIIYSSSTTPQSSAISYVENVRFGSNYTHAKVIASGGANIIMQCSNVKYGGYPFTIGFYATNDGSGIGRIQLRNVTSTNGGIVTTPGLIFAKADAQSCGFIVNGCLLTKAQGLASGTGFYVENGGFLRLTAVNFQRWGVGIDAPQIGSAPSIDAIALNFENNTIDVNIVHSGATGKIQGTDNFLKTIINQNSPLYEVNQDPKEITVSKKGGDFSSIKSAIDYLILYGNTSITNRYIISVGPGEFYEDEIDLTQTPYVSIVGSNIQTTQILPRTNNQHLLRIGQNNEVSFLSFSGAPIGYSAIYCYDIGDFGQAHKCSFYDCDTNIWVESVTQDTKFYGEYIDYNGEYEYGTKVIGNNGYVALVNMENYFNFPTGTGVTYCNYATGSGATLSIFVGDSQTNGVSGSTAYHIQDSSQLYASTITVDGFTYGIRNPNIGGSTRFDVDNASFVDGEWDLYVESLDTFGTFGGSSNHEKVFTNSSNVYWSFLDINDGEFDITRKISVTFQDGSHTDLSTLVFEGGSMGLISGGTLNVVSGTTVQADGGFGYLEKSDDSGVVRRIDWDNTQITLLPDTDEYIFINENGLLSSSGGRPDTQFNILLGRVVVNSTSVEFIDLSPFNAEHTSNRFGDLLAEALGPIYAFGSVVTEGTVPYTINVTSGEYYYSTNEYLPIGGTGITFTQYYRNGTGSTWITSATTIVNNSQYDDNGTLTGLTTGYYTKHTLYTVGDGSYENYFLVLGQNEYSTLVEAEGALLPTPPTYFSDSVTQIANIYIQEGGSGFTQVEDIKPTISFRAGGVNASSVHGNLLGLGADDHTQYLLVSGSRSMSGNLDMGSNNITNVGTVDGVNVGSHSSRHKFGGLDQVGTTTPTPNAIPYADVSGTLNDWISTATITTLGKVKLSVTPLSPSNPVVVGDNDERINTPFSAVSYNNQNILTFTNTTGGTSSVLFNTVTGWTVNGKQIINQNNGVVGLDVINPTESMIQVQNNPTEFSIFGRYTGETYFYSTSAIPIVFYTNGNNKRMTIDSNGNVGIGTINPLTKLHVSGDTIINGYLSATTISGGTFYGDGSNLTGINIYNLTGGTEGQIITKNSSSDYDYDWKYYNEVIQLQIISEGNTISDGFKGYRYVDKDTELNKITIQSNSAATVDFRVDAGGTTIGTTGISGQTYYTDSVLTGWTTSLSGGTFIEFYVDSAGSINTTQGVITLIIEGNKKI